MGPTSADATFLENMASEKHGKVDLTPEEARDKITAWVKAQHWFSGVMLEKMLKNNHKAGWKEMTTTYLRKRIEVELAELKEAMYNENQDNDVAWARAVVDECADVANFAMMLADNAKDTIRI